MFDYEFYTEDDTFLKSIKDYIGNGLGDHIKSKNIVSGLMASMVSLESDSIELFIEYLEDNKANKEEVLKELGFANIGQLKLFVQDLRASNKELTGLIINDMSTYLVSDELTIREASYITFAEALVATTEAFTSYILLKTYEFLKVNFIPVRVKAKRVTIAKIKYNRPLITMDSLIKVSKLPNDVKVSGNVGVKGNTKVKLPDNFQTNLFNPIWSVRKWLVDEEKIYYDRLKEEQRLLELRLLELRTSSNPELEKRAHYFERELATYDKEISKFEKGL